MNIFNLESLISKYFQPTNPTCIDLILTNKKVCFKNSNALEVGTSDHYNFITAALKNQPVKGLAPMIIHILKMCSLNF